MKKGILLLLVLLFVVPSAYAFEERKDDIVIIEANEVVLDDVYVLAQSLIVNGTVTGDVYAVATDIEINGTVEGDVVVFAQTVSVKGRVADDLRMLGNVLTLQDSAAVTGDVVFVGNGVEAKRDSRVSGDMLALGRQASFKGGIADDVRAAVGSAEFIGTIGGNVYLTVDAAENAPRFDFNQLTNNSAEMPQIAHGLSFGDSAEIGGSLAYKSTKDIAMPSDVVSGDIVYLPPEGVDEAGERLTLFGQFESAFGRNLQRFGVIFVLGLLVATLASGVVEGSAERLRRKPLPSFAWGLVIVLVMPFLLVLVLSVTIGSATALGFVSLGTSSSTIALIGSLLMLFLLLLYLLSLFFLGYVTVSLTIGRIILRKTTTTWSPLLLGLLILTLLLALPFNIGAALNILVILLGAGALLLAWRTPAPNEFESV